MEGRTEVEFYDSECCVQSNLPIPKQNDVYYWEAKIYDKPDTTTISIGVTTKPYPLFRMPGYHKTSVAFDSLGNRRFNQPFQPTANYAPPYVRGDVVGCGYRPRTGTLFFTRNGKKLDDVTHTLRTQNLFPTVGANGPCSVHVNFGQMGFVFIEANVKKWGLAPMTGSLAPPPPYGSEAGSILVESGQHGVNEGQAGQWLNTSTSHSRSRSATVRLARQAPASPGPQRSPTDISLAQLERIPSPEATRLTTNSGESTSVDGDTLMTAEEAIRNETLTYNQLGIEPPPPEYTSPPSSEPEEGEDQSDDGSTPRAASASTSEYSAFIPPPRTSSRTDQGKNPARHPPSPPIPSYDAAMGRASMEEEGESSRRSRNRRRGTR